MRVIASAALLATFALVATTASAQPVEEIIEKAIAASGGREALAKVTSREVTGTMTLTTPGGDVAGTIAVLNQAPNKMHTVITLDLSAAGAGTMTVDQRFDGTNGFATNTMQGDTPVTSSQLDTWRNAIFPSPLLDYKARNTKIELTGKDKIGDDEAYVLLVTPQKGPPSRIWVDARTYHQVKAVSTIEVPDAGMVEQAITLSDFRQVDGVQVPFKFVGSSAAQSFTVVVTKVEHNVKVDPSRFARPAR